VLAARVCISRRQRRTLCVALRSVVAGCCGGGICCGVCSAVMPRLLAAARQAAARGAGLLPQLDSRPQPWFCEAAFAHHACLQLPVTAAGLLSAMLSQACRPAALLLSNLGLMGDDASRLRALALHLAAAACAPWCAAVHDAGSAADVAADAG
jgi:hypothetical protein